MTTTADTRDFLVPDLGEGLLDATITSWAVEVGDSIALNQILCTVETNKAEVEIPSPYAGRVVERGGPEGATLAVGTLLVRIATDSSHDSVPSDSGSSMAQKSVLVGYGADDAMDRSRRARTAPKTRKLAAELAVDLAKLEPAPDGEGIITAHQVLSAAEELKQNSGNQTIAVRGVQARMAERMVLSRKNIPDAHASVYVDCSALLRLSDRIKITPFVLVLRFTVIALARNKVLNSTWAKNDQSQLDTSAPQESIIKVHNEIRLGIAVASERGLVVPVVENAHTLTTAQLNNAVESLIDKARTGTLLPSKLGNSTFTVSNFGALGLDEGVPIINYPEAAILGVGLIKPRAIVIDDQVVARPTTTLTCAFDHRIADGAQVATFLTELREMIESPETVLREL